MLYSDVAVLATLVLRPEDQMHDAQDDLRLDFGLRTGSDESTVTVSVAGEVDLYTSSRLWHGLAEALNLSPTRLVINLERVTFIDCAGTNALFWACEHDAAPREIIIRAAGPIAAKLFEITGLDRRCVVEPAR